MPMRRLPSLTALLWLGASACLGLACRSSQSSHTPKVDELREFVLSEAAPEEASETLSGARHSHRELLDQLAEVVAQPKIKGVFLRAGTFSGAWARAAELQAALAHVREAKKPVHCYFDQIDNVGYALLASSCDRISMGPTGMLALTGVQAQVVYARDLLELIGLQAELMQVGRFKGAADALTRNDMPSEVREVLNSLVDDLQAALSGAVMKGRAIDAATFTRAVDEGPHAASAALARHLVDAIAFDDEARQKAKLAAGAERVVRVFAPQDRERLDLGDLVKALLGGGRAKPHGQRLALAYLDGMINDDEREQGSSGASGPFIAALHRFGDDDDVRAVVLRINSPGGSALASDKMWHAVARVAKRKPVIVSVGDMAASGGYYVACAANEIFAENESLVGSIGVVGGKIVGQNLASKLGVRVTALARGRNAGWMSLFHPFSDSERKAVMLSMQETYDTFLARVRDGRKLEPSKLLAVAEGRIMSGKRAREGGLVDTIGGLSEALAHARDKAGLPADSHLEVWPEERSFFERASQMFSQSDSKSPAWQGLVPEFARSPVLTAWLAGQTGTLTALPYALDLR
jgi:protease-4